MRRRYFWRGVYVACGTVLCTAVVLIVQFGFAYDGTCGGFMPWLAGPKPCPFWEYASGNLLLFAVLFGATYWPLVLAVLLLPPLVGYLLDRRG